MLRSFRFSGSLVPALIASISVHAVILAVVAPFGPAGPASAADAGAPLSVQLAKAAAIEPEPLPPVASPTSAAALMAALGAEPARAVDAGRSESPEPPSAPAPPAKAEQPAETVAGTSPLEGHVDVAPDSILARLSEELGSRALSEFPVEVERPVGIGAALNVAYPPSALRDRREGQVLAWIVVSDEGLVEEIHIVEGSEEFASAVIEALASARFVPAAKDVEPIRFHATLQFNFSVRPSHPPNVAGSTEESVSR